MSICGLDTLTWDNILRIHRIIVLEKAEAIHELDFFDITGAMRTKVLFDIGLSD